MGLSRNENILENMLGASNPIPSPMSREEKLLIELKEKYDGYSPIPFIIPITRDNITGAYVSDVTWASILEAYNAGARLICSGYIDDASRVINIELKEVKDENGYLTFLFETEEDMYYWTLISIHSPTEGNYPFANVHHEATGKQFVISFTNSGSGWEADTTFQIAREYFGNHVPVVAIEASVTGIVMTLTAISDTAFEFSAIDPSSGDLIVFVFDANDSVTMTTYPQTPFEITLTQSGFDFSIDKTIAEITEAYQQNRQIWLQGVVTMDGSTFFNFKSQLNGVVGMTAGGTALSGPHYTFVVEYDLGNGSVYHTVVSCFINPDDEDTVTITPIVLS